MEVINMITKEQLEKIKDIIDEQLEIRCIKVETEVKYKKKKIELTSTNFQTIPAIHRNLSIMNFGGSVYKDEKEKDVIIAWIPVSVRYEGNGERLFNLEIVTRKDNKEDAWIKKIVHKLG